MTKSEWFPVRPKLCIPSTADSGLDIRISFVIRIFHVGVRSDAQFLTRSGDVKVLLEQNNGLHSPARFIPCRHCTML